LLKGERIQGAQGEPTMRFASKKNWTLTAFSILVAAGAAACGAPEPEDTDESSAAICANGVHPGCGQCVPDASSPKGGYRTCWTCGDSYQQACFAPQTVHGTWNVTANVWSDSGYLPQKSRTFPVDVTYERYPNGWYLAVGSFSQAFGAATVSLQSGQRAAGLLNVQTGSDSFALPLHVAAPLGVGFDTTFPMSTDTTITPPGSGPVSGARLDGAHNLTVVGTANSGYIAALAGSVNLWLELSGPLTNVPTM
jgi:hypothetical protein